MANTIKNNTMMYVGVGVMLLCSVGIGVAFALNTDEEKPVTPTTTTTNDEDDEEEEEEEEETVLATYVPEDFSAKTAEYKYKGPYRLSASKTGWHYNQTAFDVGPESVDKCKKMCDDRPLCPGFSLEWHRGVNKMNCMYYKENTTGGVASEECITDPGSKPECRHTITTKDGVGGLYWRGK